jgi:hypothetical protein
VGAETGAETVVVPMAAAGTGVGVATGAALRAQAAISTTAVC